VGPLGLALLVAALALPLLAARACPPAAAAYAALLAHAAVDWDWELPVLFVAGIACAAACLVAETARAPHGRGSRPDG
jgi:membrane protein implicated in regulation of membrane protease activity